MTTDLTPTTEDHARKLALMQAVGLDKLAPAQRELAVNLAHRYDLDLLLKHLVMIEGRAYVTRDGLLHVAHRSGVLDGITVTDPVLDGEFWRATCSVYRRDMSHPFTYAGRYPAKGGNAKYAPEMATKVAEVAALRRAFDVSMATVEERWDDAAIPPVDPPKRLTLAEKVAEKVAEVAPGMTREEFLAGLEAAGIAASFAEGRSKAMFPGVAGKDLSDAQRAELFSDLTSDQLTIAGL